MKFSPNESEQQSISPPPPPPARFGKDTAAANGNPLDGCLHVYLDVGSNVGVQVRKVYQPGLFPWAPSLKVGENDKLCTHLTKRNFPKMQRDQMF